MCSNAKEDLKILNGTIIFYAAPISEKFHEQNNMFPCKVRRMVKQAKATSFLEGPMKRPFKLYHGIVSDLTFDPKSGYVRIPTNYLSS
jgi:hypothetical protein